MNSNNLLALLADGEFHSGQALADRFEVSRTAVWKHVAALTQLGVTVERVRGRGYRIEGGLELLEESTIRSLLSPETGNLLEALQVHRQVDSTNAVLLREPPLLPGRGRVALAEMQTHGRGRRGKNWVSPFARNIYLSFDWQFGGGVQEIEGLSLAIGVAVADAIADCSVAPIELKWPNDLLHGGRKLGGILVEMSGDAEGPCRAVVGVGLNVSMPQSSVAAVDQPWTDLYMASGGTPPGRNVLAAALIDHCLQLLDTFARDGFSAWRECWVERDAFANTEVVLSSGPTRIAGIARGVDDRGALLLETTMGLRTIVGGEMSLRVAP